jgi:hypothetical protein
LAARISLDRDIDVKELARLAGTFRRTADALGLQARNTKQSTGGFFEALRADEDRRRAENGERARQARAETESKK